MKLFVVVFFNYLHKRNACGVNHHRANKFQA